MDHRIYLVIYNHPEQGLLGVHADGSSEEASALAWKMMQDEAMLGREVVDTGIADIPEHGLRQLCLGVRLGRVNELMELDASDCPHPSWGPLHPAWDFESLSRAETPAYIKRWLAFEAGGRMSAPTREPLDELALLRAENDRLRGLLEARWPVDLVKGQRAPFPYFGNKRIAAPIMWAALGNPGNLVIPFAGSLAELWARPEVGKVETINDGSGLVANVWRAIQRDPDAVAVHADHPVIELDLHAWHRELVAAAEDLRAKLQNDPRFYDAELAGRWIWGASAWLGSGWCDGTLPLRRPEISGGSGRARNGHGVHGNSVGDRALHQTRPHLGGGHGSASTGTGVHKTKLPRLIGSNGGAHLGNGVNSSLPASVDLAQELGAVLDRQGEGRRLDGLVVWMRQLADRLRLVRITCGDFSRVLTPAVTISHGLTGVILDPPYGLKVRTKRIYDDEDAASMEHEETVAQRAAAWAREVGEDPLYRIVLCGYEGEHEMPSSWWCVPWTARGGYGLQAHGRGRENREKERLWFSPGCIREASGTQFLLPGLG